MSDDSPAAEEGIPSEDLPVSEETPAPPEAQPTPGPEMPSTEPQWAPAAPPPPPPPAPEGTWEPPAPTSQEGTWAPPPPPAQYAPPPPPPYGAPVAGMGGRPGPASDGSKILAGLGYLIPLIALVMLFVDPYKDEKFVKFHSVQSLATVVVQLLSGVLLIVPILGWLAFWVVAMALLVLRIVGLVKALQGEYYDMPGIYPMMKSYVGE